MVLTPAPCNQHREGSSGPRYITARTERPCMFGALAKKLFGSSNDRRLKTYVPSVERINALEKDLEGLSDEALRARTQAFRDELAAGKTLDDILAEAFATVREAAKRTLGQRHFDVQ